MKHLLLVRHAKSSWKDESLADRERPLAGRGKRAAKALGVYLEQRDLAIDLVLCSPARRARDTWSLVAKELSRPPAKRKENALYLPSLETLLSTLRETPATVNTLLVVGHSPSLDALLLSGIAELRPEQRARITAKFPTAALAALDLPLRSWRQLGRTPGRLRYLGTAAELAAAAPAAPAAPDAPEQPTKGERPRLSAAMHTREAARLAISSSLTQLRLNAAGAHAGVDPEFAHQLRVGVRKLRVFLRLFRRQVGVARAARLQTELRWLFQSVGKVRELDVFIESVLGTLSVGMGAKAREELSQHVRAVRARLRDKPAK